ncbi:MAG: CPBP family intramembrane metalloprotease [Candidatus Gastranaerophilales bacterium]|nr:CPBP family intramembrane metalloprotease [Candidatus Gastranaerophilales bacterium]
MDKLKTIFLCATIEIILIVCVGVANIYPNPLNYFLFYNILYGIVSSFVLPLFLLRKEGNLFNFIGVKAVGKKQIAVLSVFVVFSVGGQLIPIVANGGTIPWELLPVGVIPLIMTTFFEEFLFRGFIQSKFEKDFGALPAILVSGLMFSLYHIGYPGFRTLGDISLLFAVGVGFAIAYKLSGNNLTVAYFVNLPNAFVTYMLKFDKFPVMGLSSTIAGIITFFVIFVIYIVFRTCTKKEQ